MLDPTDLDAVHTFASQNRPLLALSSRAGCFACCRMFAPREITVWVDGAAVAADDRVDGVTALCPYCGVDAVLPSLSYSALTDRLLADMQQRWFAR